MNSKKKTIRIDFCEANNRFSSQRDDIFLCEDGFVGWKKKSKFWDKVEKDYFWSIPADVYKLKTVHPNRRNKKKTETNIKKFGSEWATQSKQIKEKSKQTNLKNWGKEYYLQTEDKKEKSKATNLKKYGVRHHTQSDKVKEKTKQTNIKKYGVDNPIKNKSVKQKAENTILRKYGVKNVSQVDEFKEKRKHTNLKHWGKEHYFQTEDKKTKSKIACLRRYGVEHQMHSDIIKKKLKNTCLNKYGVDHFSKTSAFLIKINKKTILETGGFVIDWLKEQNDPKPHISTINQIFSRKNITPIKDLEEYLERYRSYKSNLELISEELFEIKHYNKKPKEIQKLYRPDFKLTPDIFLNVDGLYWHSELQKDRWYHFEMRKEFENNGLRIFQFYENEIRDKPMVVKSIVDNSLGKIENKIFARACQIKQISQNEANAFLNENHLMGTTNAKHVGLYYNNNLVSILSYKQIKHVCKIERFCSISNYIVIGGFSKLLKHLEQNILKPDITEIYNWVDLRYGTGYHLKDKGFKLLRDVLGWKWTDGRNTFNRLTCRANMTKEKLSQREYAQKMGLVKIHDAGQRLYVKNL